MGRLRLCNDAFSGGHHREWVICAALAACLFGASTPLAKLLVGKVQPIPLAGFIYLGSGLALLLPAIFCRSSARSLRRDAPLSKSDLGWLAGAIAAGGIAAPIALMFGLWHTPAPTAALLLNFEGVATALVAALLFREAVGRRAWWAIGCITCAGILLSWKTGDGWGVSIGAIGVLSASVLWGLDNNLTRNIAAKDPLSIVAAKGLCSGPVSLLLAWVMGNTFPDPGLTLAAMGLGAVTYGVSITLFIPAMRGLGAARACAYFGMAPFVGAAISFTIFRTLPNAMFLTSVPLMILGAALLLSESHLHSHSHDSLAHEHRHRHDDGHHAHEHDEHCVEQNRHSHPHRHEQAEHIHPHMPDDHHRHLH